MLTAPIPVPLTSSVHEYSCRLLNAHGLPPYLDPVLTESLKEFVAEVTDEWHKNNAQDVVAAVDRGDVDPDRLAAAWTRAFTEEHIMHAHAETISNEEVFSDMYHTLVHSPVLYTLLSLEHSYAVQMEGLVQKRDDDLAKLQSRQTHEMEEAVQRVGLSTTDEEVNALAVKQLEDIQMLESKWESEISALRRLQKSEFQEWIAKVHEDYHTSGGSTHYQTPRTEPDAIPNESPDHWSAHSSRLEESFTIHLGAQLKQMHNLRLLSADVLDLCHSRPVQARNVVPQRLQTALSLYSNDLCGLVILVDSRVNSYTGIKREFARICQTSTEFHFSGLEDQLESVRDLLPRVAHWRMTNEATDEGSATVKCTAGIESQSPQVPALRPGDVYITRHSNLTEVHVSFHVVVDDSIRSPDISSRHPVILALRNVLKVACLCDIATVTLPLLLVHEMSEEMTMSWCLKRAELIYKCVKGFMIEMASWGGAESRTVQFLVPKGISDDLFSNLSTMLPSIFRTSNPLKANAV